MDWNLLSDIFSILFNQLIKFSIVETIKTDLMDADCFHFHANKINYESGFSLGGLMTHSGSLAD